MKSGHNSPVTSYFLAFPYTYLLNLPLLTNLILCLLFSFNSLGSPCLPENTEHGLNLESSLCPFLSAWETLSQWSSLLSMHLPESLGLNVIFPARTSQTVLGTVNTCPPHLSQATILTVSSTHLHSHYYISYNILLREAMSYRLCLLSVFLCRNIPSKRTEDFSPYFFKL